MGIGLVCLLYAGVLLARVGYWREHMPSAVARFADLNAWLVVIVLLVGAIQNFTALDDPFTEGFFLIIAGLAFVVVRSERPVSPTSGTAPSSSGKSGPPSSAHYPRFDRRRVHTDAVLDSPAPHLDGNRARLAAPRVWCLRTTTPQFLGSMCTAGQYGGGAS